MSRRRWYRLAAIAAVVVVLLLALRTCGSGNDLSNLETGEEIDAELTLRSVVLEQPDENGNLLWRLKAQSVNYSPDNQQAELAQLNGEFFQEGETVYTVTADEGEVQQNGETLFLRGNLVATSIASELILESEKLRWQPKQDLLVMGAFEGGDFKGDDSPHQADNPSHSEPSNNDTERADQADSQTDEKAATALTIRSVADLFSGGNTIDKLSADVSDKAPVTGFNPQLEAIAQVISVSNKGHQVQLSGGVVAKSKENPWITFESDSLDWFTDREVIEAKQPLKVEQYAGEDYQMVTDRVVGATGQVQLAQNIVTLDRAVQLDSITQPLKVTSESAVWDVTGQTVVLDKPVDIEQPERKITASANQANLDLEQSVLVLTGNVLAKGEKNDARLAADQVQWQTTSQDVEAEGNVSYQQAANPEISMTGTQAIGNLENGTVVVTGGDAGDVVTEFVPDAF